jgi:putative ABC transport system permease protein
MKTPTKKVIQDFKGQKLRTLLVVLSILVGVFCITGVGTMDAVLTKTFSDAFSNAHAPDISVQTAYTSPSLLGKLTALPNVTGGEVRTSVITRWKTTGDWSSLELVGIEDFNAMKVDKISLHSGSYPTSGQIMPEFTSTQLLATSQGQQITLQGVSAGRPTTTSFTVSGYGVHSGAPPANVTGISTAYMPQAAVQRLAGVSGANEFLLTIRSFSRKDQTTAAVRSVLQQNNVPLQGRGITVRDPDPLKGLDTFKSLEVLLLIFGFQALGLSGMLVLNTLSNVVSQQTPHIGTMKAVGATRTQVVRTYLTLGLLYGSCGTALGIILGVTGGYGIVSQIASHNGISVSGLVVSPAAVIRGLLVGIFVTLFASLLPALRGSKITVKQAISSYGLGAGYKPSALDAVVSKLAFISRPARMSVRNMFRNRQRLMLTLIPLSMSGAVFLAVTSTATGLNNTIDQAKAAYAVDFLVNLGVPGPVNQVQSTAQSVSGVRQVEAWFQTAVTVQDKTDVLLDGVPGDNSLYHYTLRSGRWLTPSDSKAVVLSETLARDKGISVGDTVPIKASDLNTVEWQVVGIVNDQTNSGNLTFAPLSQVQSLMGAEGRTNYLFVVASPNPGTSSAAVNSVIGTMGDKLFSLGLQPRFVKINDLESSVTQPFIIITTTLYAMVALVIIVGSLGLFAVLAMNVVERRKEIGVMRSIGASSRDVMSVFTYEGLAIAALASVLGTIVSLPMTAVFKVLVTYLLVDINFTFSPLMVLLMWIILLIVAALSSLVPAASAARLKVGEVLRYG